MWGKRRLITLAVAMALGALLLALAPGSKDEIPQPIAFSHRTHVVQNRIDCSYCHEYYEKHAVAGVPRIETCMSCHLALKRDHPEIRKLFGYWEKKQEIPWVRLYRMPDHVIFTHKRHVRAAIDCSTCHGDIGQSDRFLLQVKHTMGSCMDCHRARNVSNDCLTCHK